MTPDTVPRNDGASDRMQIAADDVAGADGILNPSDLSSF